MDAENNWWGVPDGPGPVGPGSGDNVTTNIDFTPFLASPTGPGCPGYATPTPTASPAPTDTPVTTTPAPTTPAPTNTPVPTTPAPTNTPVPTTPAQTPSPTVNPTTQTPHPTGAVGGFVDVVRTGGTGSSSGGLSIFALLAIIVAISAVSGSGLYAFVRRRY